MSNTHHPTTSPVNMSDDEWEDVVEVPQTNATASWATVDAVEFAKGGHKYHIDRPATLELLNLDGRVVHRDEGVKGRHPTLIIPGTHQRYPRLLLTLSLFHDGCEHVHVRFPNPKDKCEQYRGQSGLWINATKTSALRLKKKAVDHTTYEDLAFRLGADFKFHTHGIDPSFIVVATPFEDGRFWPDKAIRSEPFFVRSKRQERHQSGPHKRRKKARELQKINTDIESARTQKESLEQQNARSDYVMGQHTQFLKHLNRRTRTMPDGPAKIALLHATRMLKRADTVSL